MPTDQTRIAVLLDAPRVIVRSRPNRPIMDGAVEGCAALHERSRRIGERNVGEDRVDERIVRIVQVHVLAIALQEIEHAREDAALERSRAASAAVYGTAAVLNDNSKVVGYTTRSRHDEVANDADRFGHIECASQIDIGLAAVGLVLRVVFAGLSPRIA